MIKRLNRQLIFTMPFNSFFPNVEKKLAAEIKHTCKIKNHEVYSGPRQQLLAMFLNPTDEFKVLEGIQNLSSRKSPGYIDIPVAVFKHSKFIIAS